MSGGSQRGRAAALVILGAAVLVLLVFVLSLHYWDALFVGGRLDLLMDGAHVDLLEGFAGTTELRVHADKERANYDRGELPVLLPRNGKLRWRLQAPEAGGTRRRLVTSVARLVLGPGSDESVCRMRFTSKGSMLEQTVPPCPEEEGWPAGLPREGPSIQIEFPVPDDATEIAIAIESEAPPDGSLALLLSPRLLGKPKRFPLDKLPLSYASRTSLLTADDSVAPEVSFAHVREEGIEGQRDVVVREVEAVSAFEGQGGRPALALTGAASWSADVTIPAGAVLSGALALDRRLPPGTSVALDVHVDGAPVATLICDSTGWTEVAVPLPGRDAPESRRLELRIGSSFLQRAWVPTDEVDYERGKVVPVECEALLTRVGFAQPAIETLVTVPRRSPAPEEEGWPVADHDQLSVLLIQVETLRGDLLSTSGIIPPLRWPELQGVDLTPELRKLAGGAQVYTAAMAPSPWTVPTTATLLTGLLPSAHGAVAHDRILLPEGALTIAERARARGIATAAIVATDVLPPRAGFARGFEQYAHVPLANARQVRDLALGWLSEHVGQQFFLFLHLFDPHHPWNAPGEWRDRFVEPELRGADPAAATERLVQRLWKKEAIPQDDPDLRLLRQLYVGEIAWLDEQLGELFVALHAMELDRTTAIVLTADHGEEFGEHGLFGHGSNLFDETLHVPLIVWSPATRDASLVNDVVSTAGIGAWVLQAMGLGDVTGDLWPAVPERRGLAWSETNKGVLWPYVVAGEQERDPLNRFEWTLSTARHRLIVREAQALAPLEEECLLFDLRDDPGCLAPLPCDAGGGLREAGRKILEASAARAERRPTAGLDADMLETLRGLGYVGRPDG